MLEKEFQKLKATLADVQSGKVSDREMSKLIVQLTEVNFYPLCTHCMCN